MQGWNERGQVGGQFPGVESQWKRRMAAGGAENSQQCHKYLLQIYFHKQWRISGMAGMARAIGATLTGAQNCLTKIKIFMHSFLNLHFSPHARTEQG